MSTIEKLNALRERTVLTKAANALQKQGGVEAVINSMLKATKKGGNALANTTMASEKGKRKKSDSFRKESMATPSSGRPGAGITAMGAGMAPFQFQAQPQVAQQSLEIAGRGLGQAYPGLTPATKSTSSMKRNSGSITASATRQTPKKAKGALIGPNSLQGDKTVIGSADIALMEKAAMRKFAEMDKEAFLGPLIRGGIAAGKALFRGGGLRGAFGAGRAANTAHQTSRIAAGARTLPVATNAGSPSNLRILSGAAPRMNPSEFGRLARTKNFLRNSFNSGIGFQRNVFTQVNPATGRAVSFAGPKAWYNFLPGGARYQTMALNRAAAKSGMGPITLTRTGTGTGGVGTQAIKSVFRGGALGTGAGYGASFVPGIGDPSTQNVGLFDRQRLNMAAGGALIGAGGFGGGTKRLAGALGVAAFPLGSFDTGMTMFSPGRENIAAARRLRGGHLQSKMDSVNAARARGASASQEAAREAVRQMDNRARK